MTEREKSVDALDEKTIHHSPSIAAETTNKDQRVFVARDLVSLSVDELWNFRGELDAILTAKIVVEVRELDRRIDRLSVVIDNNNRTSDSSKRANPHRRPYPAVLPKYRNLAAPSETWSGRGRQPRWLTAQLNLGKRLKDFKILATVGK
jgi:DNA-binding protein H-NS